MGQIIRVFAAFVLLWWVGTGVAVLLLPAPYGLIPAAVLFLWLLYGVILRRGRPGERRRRAQLRLRPLRGEALRATLLAVPVAVALVWAVSTLWLALVPVPERALYPFEGLTGTPAGRLTVSLLAVVAAPLLEEFVFRGVVQWHLERRWGPAVAISVTAAAFALFHLNPWVLPVHLLLGLLFGFAVWATRSLWSAVVLHAANNALAVFGLAGGPEPVPTVWETGEPGALWMPLAVLVLATAAAARVGRRLLRAGGRAA